MNLYANERDKAVKFAETYKGEPYPQYGNAIEKYVHPYQKTVDYFRFWYAAVSCPEEFAISVDTASKIIGEFATPLTLQFERHIHIFQQGIEDLKRWDRDIFEQLWNLLYYTQRTDVPDYEYQDLEGVDLSNQNLRFAMFHQAELKDANLQHADLRFARLTQAGLRRTNFQHANLIGAKFRASSLHETHFVDCDLRGAIFCDLRGANCGTFIRCNLRHADFSFVDLNNIEFEDCTY